MLVAYLAPDVLGEALGWIAGVGLIVLTGVVSLLYLRKSDSEWSPAEQAITAQRTGRFERTPSGSGCHERARPRHLRFSSR